jgi:hypothetical protein
MPFGSLTADQEIPKGTVTCAPLAGPRIVGAGGPEEEVGVGVGGGTEVAVGVEVGGVTEVAVGVEIGVGDDVLAGVGVRVGVLLPLAEACGGSRTTRASRSEMATKKSACRVVFLIPDLLHTRLGAQKSPALPHL